MIESEYTVLGPQPASPLFVPHGAPDKENDGPVGRDEGLKFQDSGSRPPAPGVGKRRSTVDSPFAAPEDILQIGGETGEQTYTEASREADEATELSRPPVSETLLGGPDHHKQKTKKKRRSVLLVRKKRRSSGPKDSSLASAVIESSVQENHSQISSEAPAPPEALPFGHRIEKWSRVARRKQNTDGESPDLYRERTPVEEDEEGDETYVQESSPEPQTPAPAKKTKKRKGSGSAENGGQEISKPKQSKATFPILTHRLTGISTLQTIHEAGKGENESGGEDIPPQLGFNDRAQPNAVDVLAQICRETIETMIERMSQNSERANMKNKRDALEAFGKDLDEELFEMSEAVENRINLEARVRKSKRDKSALQTEWVELRKERERIALKCDAIRRRNWKCEQEAREKWTLSDAARRAERELERENQDDEEGMEILLRSVAGDVSSASEQGGLLHQVRAFNAQLEAMALVLEGRQF